MVNQDPQPEIYTTTHNFANGAAANVVNSQYINTFQSANEETRIYAIAVDIQNTSGADVSADYSNFDLQIGAGVNPVPTNFFDIGFIAKGRTRMIELTCPVVVKFKQPLRVSVRFSPATTDPATTLGAETDVIIRLIGEIGIQKVVN